MTQLIKHIEPITEEQRNKIIELNNDGYTISSIARHFDLARSRVKHLIHRQRRLTKLFDAH
jgi:DNA-directed RNA polymerase specialized sigma24 family protein